MQPTPVNLPAPSRGPATLNQSVALFRWCSLLVGLISFVIVPFFLFGATTEAWAHALFDSSPHRWILAVAIGSLLAIDVFLPIPSSMVSTTAGSALGVTLGALVSFLGMSASCALGWLAGAHLGKPVADLVLGSQEMGRMRRLLGRHGLVAVVLCRPVPVAAEASVILAGTAGLNFGRTMLVSSLANLGISAVYAIVGAQARETRSFLYAFLAAVFLPTACFLAYRAFAGPRPH